MFVHAAVTSKRAMSNSKGKKQGCNSDNPNIFIEPNVMDNRYRPLLQMKMNDSHTIGTGWRGGDPQEFTDEAVVRLDVETFLACAQVLIENKLLAAENMFSLQELLEASLRLASKPDSAPAH